MTCRQMAVLFIGLLAAAIGLSAQDATYQMKVDSGLLPLDVVVKDSGGRTVLDLKQSDFEIYEEEPDSRCGLCYRIPSANVENRRSHGRPRPGF
jgi:hypothetical protein